MNEMSVNKMAASESSELKEVIQPYLRRWWWFMVSLVIILSLTFFYLSTTTPAYTITSSALIKDTKKSPSSDMGVLSQLGGFGNVGTNSIENEIEILKSKTLMREVVNSLGLQFVLENKEGLRTIELYGSNSPIITRLVSEKKYDVSKILPIKMTIEGEKITLMSDDLSKPLITTFNKLISLPYANLIIEKNKAYQSNKEYDLDDLTLKYKPTESTISDFQKLLNIELADKDGTVLNLSLPYAHIPKGEKIINKLIDSYNGDAIKDKNEESKKTKEFIDERINVVAAELGDVESRKEQFKVANKITDIPLEASMSLSGSLSNRSRLLETETQLELTNDLINYMNKISGNSTLPSSVGLGNPAASANIAAYNELVLERNNLLENATTKNPIVSDLNKQIASLRTSVMDNLLKSRNSLIASRDQVAAEQNLLTSKIAKIPSQEKLFRNIERQQQIKENLYLLLLQKREEAAISLAITAPKAKVIDRAYPSDKPTSPKKLLILAASLIVAFLVPFAYIYLKELFNTKIRSKHDIEKISSIPLVGEIPSKSSAQPDLIQPNDLSPMAEAFRIAITNMNFLLPKKDVAKRIFVTSSIKGEGKTYVSVNLALTLATSRQKVLLIGSDIRNPQLQRYTPESKGFHGLTEYLYSDETKADEIIYKSPFNQYCDVIYSGSIPPNPAELLANGRYEQLVSELASRYDYIIFDTAPLMLVTDTLLFADMADATLYVTRSGYSDKALISFANKLVSGDKIKNTAFILNDVKREYFGYGNKYGYGYQAEEKRWWEKFKSRF